MFQRKDCKKRAKKNLKNHYFLFVCFCFIAAILGTEYSSSYTELSDQISHIVSGGTREKSDFNTRWQLNSAMVNIVEQDRGNTETQSKHLIEKAAKKKTTKVGSHLEIGYKHGVLANIVNSISSGAYLLMISSALYSVVKSATATVVILSILSSLILFLFSAFIISVFKIIYVRFFLEGRIYKKVPFRRVSYLLYTKKWMNVSWVLFVTSFYKLLWIPTIVGGIIKHFSYFAVPYIISENPSISAKDTITLSRKMMNGHKWECCLLYLSFWGWIVLDFLTFGLVGIFYGNPYREATLCEYYTHLRRLAKENNIENVQLLNDTYLYEKAPDAKLELAYGTLADYPLPTPQKCENLLDRIFSFFGISIVPSKEQNFQNDLEKKANHLMAKAVLNKEAYPERLSQIPEKKRRKAIKFLFYDRHYSIWSLIVIFFSLSFVGWIWEVSLHLIQDGQFVNRGVLHGPWLPIYGSGCILILLLLNQLRKRPLLEFIASVLLCGCVEYTIGWALEMTHGGQKWWCYNGYFLNIDGRVCAEGLLVFGIGGMIIVYFLAPLIDNLVKLVPRKTVIAFCIVFLVLFNADQIYSTKHPNTGKGITNYKKSNQLSELTPPSTMMIKSIFRQNVM